MKKYLKNLVKQINAEKNICNFEQILYTSHTIYKQRKHMHMWTEGALLYLMFSTVSSGIGATVCTAGRFLLVAPFTKLEDEVLEGAASVAPANKTQFIITYSNIQLKRNLNSNSQ